MVPERRRTALDRRRARRVPAVFSVKNLVGRPALLGLAEDIAPSGMTIRRPRDGGYPPRTPVSLRFELPGTGEEIAARGVIVSDAPAGGYRRTGVRFLTLRPDHQRLIASYCARL